MPVQVFSRRLHERHGLLSRRQEILHQRLTRGIAVRRLQHLGRLELVRAIEQPASRTSSETGVGFFGTAGPLRIFSATSCRIVDSLTAICSATSPNRPPVRAGLERPLSVGQPGNRIEKSLPRLLQVFRERLAFGIGEGLRIRPSDGQGAGDESDGHDMLHHDRVSTVTTQPDADYPGRRPSDRPALVAQTRADQSLDTQPSVPGASTGLDPEATRDAGVHQVGVRMSVRDRCSRASRIQRVVATPARSRRHLDVPPHLLARPRGVPPPEHDFAVPLSLGIAFEPCFCTHLVGRTGPVATGRVW